MAIDPEAQAARDETPSLKAGGGLANVLSAAAATDMGCAEAGSRVYIFNPFSEGCLAKGKAYVPVKHQAQLAEDLAHLPQFLCAPQDLVLVPKRPAASFLNGLRQAGFFAPEFVEIGSGPMALENPLWTRKLAGLRPWAWGPDSMELLAPFWMRLDDETQCDFARFYIGLAQLYSKAWSADFLRKILVQDFVNRPATKSWLCSAPEAGVAVESSDAALAAIAAIRGRGHHRVVIKEAIGLAGHNAIRLWEPEILPAQRKWLAHALEDGRQLVVEPWLEREMDFSVQLEMTSKGLALCGFTGLSNDLKGQFQANWAEAGYAQRLPSRVAALLSTNSDLVEPLHAFYREVFGLLEVELRQLHYFGPISIDALIYRASDGACRLKPVVEINPRYTMGRLTVELMKQTCPGNCGVFRLINKSQANAQGFVDFSGYAHNLQRENPLILDGIATPKIRQGSLCLNDPARAQVCLATFSVKPAAMSLDLVAGNLG